MESDKYQLCTVQWSKIDLRKKRTSTKKGSKMDDTKFEIFHEIQSFLILDTSIYWREKGKGTGSAR